MATLLSSGNAGMVHEQRSNHSQTISVVFVMLLTLLYYLAKPVRAARVQCTGSCKNIAAEITDTSTARRCWTRRRASYYHYQSCDIKMYEDAIVGLV